MTPQRNVGGFVSTHVVGCEYLDTLRRDDCSCGGVARAIQEQHDREAPQLPAGYVTHAPGVGYFVQSRTTAGVWYLISGRTCSCKAGRSGRDKCWHRQQVADFVRKLSEKHTRPRGDDTSEQTVSRFVD